MSQNWVMGNVGGGLTLTATPSGYSATAHAGDVVPITPGVAKGPLAYLVTDIATGADTDAVGLASGQASRRLVPTEAIIELTVTASAGDPVFVTISDGNPPAYGTTNGKQSTGKYHIGHCVTVPGRTPAAGKAFVYLGSAGTVAPTAE